MDLALIFMVLMGVVVNIGIVLIARGGNRKADQSMRREIKQRAERLNSDFSKPMRALPNLICKRIARHALKMREHGRFV